MSDKLTDDEQVRLVQLGDDIIESLSALPNAVGLPSRTNRLQAVDDMIAYLQIHDYEISTRGYILRDKA